MGSRDAAGVPRLRRSRPGRHGRRRRRPARGARPAPPGGRRRRRRAAPRDQEDHSMTFERMWSDIAPVGRSATTRGYFRQPYTGAELEMRAWFAEEAERRGLELEA